MDSRHDFSTVFEHLDFSRERKKLLIDEGSIMASLNHERVVKLLGVILEDRDCSLVMELIPRGNLLVMLQTVSRLYIPKENIQLTISSLGSLLLLFVGFISHLLACFQVSVPLSVKGRITLEILEAMVYLSENDIIHKDIKPENILVDKDFHIKVCSALQLLIRSHSSFTAAISLLGCRPWIGRISGLEQTHQGGVSQEESQSAHGRGERRRHPELHGARAPGEHTRRLHGEVRRLQLRHRAVGHPGGGGAVCQ